MKILIAVIVTAAILIAVVAGTGGQQTRTDAQIIELKQSIALDRDAMAEATQQIDF